MLNEEEVESMLYVYEKASMKYVNDPKILKALEILNIILERI